MIRLAAALALLAFSVAPTALHAQTVTTYKAPTGAVSPGLSITMHLTGGGTAILNPVVGPNCYLGMTCLFPAGYVGTNLSYALTDGTSAMLTKFHGKFYPLGGNAYEVLGNAKGTDSAGHAVAVNFVKTTMTITCRSGRGGGCTKTYTGGSMKLTVN